MTLYEFHKKYLGNYYGFSWEDSMQDIGIVKEGALKKIIESYYTISVPDTDTIIASELTDKLWSTYICPRFKTLLVEEESFLRFFVFILKSTYDKYSTVINIYETEKANLMDSVKAYSEIKFNDTPQNNAQGQYSWSDDNHLSSINRSETSNEINTKVARLNEINTLLDNYFNEWSDEFGGLFVYGD